MPGVLGLVAFFVGPPILETVMYDSASEAQSNVPSSSIWGVNAGTKVSFIGTVKSTGGEMFGYCAMEMDGLDGLVICRNDNYKAGEKLIVTGYVYGYSGSNIVIGSSSWSMLAGSVQTAQVERPWWPMFFNIGLVLGIVLIAAGAAGIALAARKKARARAEAPPSAEMPPGPPLWSGAFAGRLPDGMLIKAPNDDTVYVMQGGAKRPISNPEVFNRHGYKWNTSGWSRLTR